MKNTVKLTVALVGLSLIVALCLASSSTDAVSIQLKRKAPTTHRIDPKQVDSLKRNRRWARNNIHMGGGVITNLATYYANISIGNPQQYFDVLIDTGSSNIVVPNDGCQSCGNGPQFDLKQSYTFGSIKCGGPACNKCVPSNTVNSWAASSNSTCVFGPSFCVDDEYCGFSITYGGGSSGLSGILALDEVCMGNLCAEQIFGLANLEAPAGSFSTDPLQGIFGLASEFNSCNPTCTPTFVDNVSQKQQIPNIFAMCLTPATGGVLDFGIVVDTRYSGDLVYLPMEVERWYNIFIYDILIGSSSINVPTFYYRTTNDVIGSFVDSGTSVILMGPFIFQSFQATFQGSEFCSLPGICGNNTFFDGSCFPTELIEPHMSLYPNVTIVIGNVDQSTSNFPVPPKSYLMLTPDGTQYCFGFGGVPSLGVILGDVFMENYYIVFDRANLQLGMAPVADCSLSS